MSAPLFGKVALDGNWEQAHRFERGEFTTEQETAQYLRGAEEVACEAFFDTGFIGVRRRGQGLESFVAGFGRAVRDAGDTPAFLERLRGLGVPVRERFLFAEVGAEGAWNSIGALRLDVDNPDFDALFGSPLAVETDHAKAIEFAYDNGDGTTHWIATFVSVDGRLDRGMLEQALEECIQSL